MSGRAQIIAPIPQANTNTILRRYSQRRLAVLQRAGNSKVMLAAKAAAT
jgi:hypothetical protein